MPVVGAVAHTAAVQPSIVRPALMPVPLRPLASRIRLPWVDHIAQKPGIRTDGAQMLYQSALTLTLRPSSIALIMRDFVVAQRVDVNADWY
jgi:hypothetical protein